MEFNKQDYIKYRLKRADETISDAVVLFKCKSWNSCMNRLYYAAFYAVNALLLSININAKTHNGVRRMFDLHFIKTNVVSKKSGNLFSVLSNMRAKGDYIEFVEFDKDTISPLLKEVKDFIEEIKSKIKYHE